MTEATQSSSMTIDKDALRRKYAEEREKRVRPDGNDQYIEVAGKLGHYLEDPYTPMTQREPVRDHVTVAFIGGGFSGLVTGARLAESGISDVRIIEKGGDFGGTWYFNRYPGRSVRHRGIRVYAVIGRNGAHAFGEICSRT